MLHPGTYVAAPFDDDPGGLAYFNLSGLGGASCGLTTATFTVDEISVDAATGKPLVFAASFDALCSDQRVRGELRMNTTVPVVSRDVTPTAVAMAIVEVGQTGPTSAITVANAGNAPLHLAAATIEGPFSLTDQCAGLTLTGSATCQILVASAPIAPEGSAGSSSTTTASGRVTGCD